MNESTFICARCCKPIGECEHHTIINTNYQGHTEFTKQVIKCTYEKCEYGGEIEPTDMHFAHGNVTLHIGCLWQDISDMHADVQRMYKEMKGG